MQRLNLKRQFSQTLKKERPFSKNDLDFKKLSTVADLIHDLMSAREKIEEEHVEDEEDLKGGENSEKADLKEESSEVKWRRCNKCDGKKPLEEFCVNKRCKEGRTRTCLACNKKILEQRHEKLKAKEYPPGALFECIKCKEMKSPGKFYRSLERSCGLRNYCKNCYKARVYARRKKNSQKTTDESVTESD